MERKIRIIEKENKSEQAQETTTTAERGPAEKNDGRMWVHEQ